MIFSMTLICQLPAMVFADPTPIAAEAFALSEWQVVQNAGSEIVIELDLGQAPSPRGHFLAAASR